MEAEGGEAVFDAAKEAVKPGDCECWRGFALEHDAGAAEGYDVGDLGEDGLEAAPFKDFV